MENNIIKLGMDIGNKNLKVCAEEGQAHEIPASYRMVDEYDYVNSISKKDMEKVKYNGKYYFVGLQCQNGLPHNKGDRNIREVANMFKLVGLARELRRQEQNKGEFCIVTGTPVNDYDAYKDDYIDLFLTKDDEYEIIELNEVEYQIKVKNVVVTKQSACIAPTIPNWKENDFILVDFGGGTLDIAYFQRGIKERYITMDFPLNEILEDLGNTLNAYKLGIPRPNSLDSGFIRTMEEIILQGKYRNVTSILVNDKQINLKDFCSQWLQNKVDSIIEDIKIKLKLSTTDSNFISVYYIGGGAKLLANELANNNGFTNKSIIENPHFANVSIYQTIANKYNWGDSDAKTQINQ
jgi:hypothetical protein